MSDRPNVVFFETDSHDGRTMGCMGHPSLRGATPNMDRLAREGVLFRNAYCNNPICCPSRASMWSGRWTHHCEGWNNYKGLEPGTRTMLDDLHDAGYRSRVIGKTDYLSGRHTIRARVSPWTRSARLDRPAYRMEGPTVHETGEVRVHERDWNLVDDAVTFLREDGKGDAPFWLHVGTGIPHPGFRTSRHYLEMIDEATVDVPELDETVHPVLEYHRRHKNWMHGLDDETVRLVRRIYFAMVAETDAMLGHLMDGLRDAGLAENTIVVFTSDHGELAMEHGTFYKMSPYDAATRVPLIMSGPGVARGRVTDELVSLVDIYPTLMDIAAHETDATLDGHSLMPLARGERDDARPDWILSEFHGTSCDTGVFMVRRGDWKYVAYPGYDPQLYDMTNDPGEIHDLAPSQPERVREMDVLLRSIVDYEAVDAKVKAYDRAAFSQWREKQRAEGTYRANMAKVYSGWDHLADDDPRIVPWTDEDEARIEAWLQETADVGC